MLSTEHAFILYPAGDRISFQEFLRNSISNRTCIFTTPTQLRRYKDSRQNYMTRTKQVDIASRAHSAVSLQSVLNPVLNCRRKLRCEAKLVPVGATLIFLWCFCCSRRRFLSKHILLPTRTCAFCASLACISCSKYPADTALVRQPECYQHSSCSSSILQSHQ